MQGIQIFGDVMDGHKGVYVSIIVGGFEILVVNETKEWCASDSDILRRFGGKEDEVDLLSLFKKCQHFCYENVGYTLTLEKFANQFVFQTVGKLFSKTHDKEMTKGVEYSNGGITAFKMQKGTKKLSVVAFPDGLGVNVTDGCDTLFSKQLQVIITDTTPIKRREPVEMLKTLANSCLESTGITFSLEEFMLEYVVLVLSKLDKELKSREMTGGRIVQASNNIFK